MTIEFIDNRNRFFEDVKALGRKNSATLGFMPEGGFEDHARNKFIIIAHDGKTLAGYLMFRVVSRFSRVSIVHLCVSEEYRGKGVSTTLLNALKRNSKKYIEVYRLVAEPILIMRLLYGEISDSFHAKRSGVEVMK